MNMLTEEEGDGVLILAIESDDTHTHPVVFEPGIPSSSLGEPYPETVTEFINRRRERRDSVCVCVVGMK